MLQGEPGNLDARLYYGAALFRDNPADSTRYEEIKLHLKRVLIERPDSALALEILGQVALEEQEWQHVRRYYQSLLLLEPGDSEVPTTFSCEPTKSVVLSLQPGS